MIATLPLLPPSGLEFEVFRGIQIEQRPPLEVARRERISVKKVAPIVSRVGLFLNEVAPHEDQDKREQRIYVAEQIAAERTNYLYSMALRAFEESRGEQRQARETSREGKPVTLVRTVKTSSGDWRYLSIALRLAHAAAKLPAPVLDASCRWEESNATDATNDDCSNPPAEDCSPATPKTSSELPTQDIHWNGSPLANEPFSEEEDRRFAAACAIERPVQHHVFVPVRAAAEADRTSLRARRQREFLAPLAQGELQRS